MGFFRRSHLPRTLWSGASLKRRKLDKRVMVAMASVPRHEFVHPGDRDTAYENRPLPIGHGQTISQPYIVAVMTDLLEPKPSCRALEVDTGSGYQAAVLAKLCEKATPSRSSSPSASSADPATTPCDFPNLT
jgi:protein-L-isoaspartate(D-aspartate) O-methyltransferase